MKKTEYFDDSTSIGGGWSRVTPARQGWTGGEYYTPQGIVSVYAQGDNENFYWTRLVFVYGGRLYMRHFINRRYSQRGIATKAKQFAQEIVEATDEVISD